MSIRFLCAASALALQTLSPCAQGAPFVPANGAQVIETLARRADPQQQQLRQMRAQLQQDPNNSALAGALAQRYIASARSEADPRYYGYAQAALAPWWRLGAPPPSIRLLRATLLQSTHHFPEALADLDGVIAADPANAQAWLTRATVLTVQGEYDKAGVNCARLSTLGSELVAITCLANVAALGARADGAEALLAATLRRAGTLEPQMQRWALTLLGEMAARRADANAADAWFRRAMAMDANDSYLIGAYADFLLDQGRAQAALELLKPRMRVDALLLRYALALRQLPGPDAARAEALRRAEQELGARFAAAMQRGDTVHQREQARYELQLRGDAKAALALARANWAVQKEAADLRVYLEAALAARDKAGAAPALAWMRQNAVRDVAARRLAGQLERLS